MHLLVKGPRLLLVGVLDHAQPVAQLLIRVARRRAHFRGAAPVHITCELALGGKHGHFLRFFLCPGQLNERQPDTKHSSGAASCSPPRRQWSTCALRPPVAAASASASDSVRCAG